MKTRILLDTGPLVAFLNRRDRYHVWARGEWGQCSPPLLTCEAVLSEACFLLRQIVPGGNPVLDLVRRGIVEIAFSLRDQVEPIRKLMEKYRTVPMSLADACLVRMTEFCAESAVLTLDTDFRLYRRHGRQVVPCIMPQDR